MHRRFRIAGAEMIRAPAADALAGIDAGPPTLASGIQPMAAESAISSVAHVIQLAVAPVFLLTGVGALLAVLTNRLSRIIDRARVLESALEAADAAHARAMHVELSILSRRARLIHWAISLCTICALLICVVIAALFISSHLAANVSTAVSLLFVLAMLALIGGLVSFLREIHLAIYSVHIGPR
jgi:hypothetical protein